MNKQPYSLKARPLKLPNSYSTADNFSHFADKPWAMFLDSSDSQHPDGRFDIMVANPIATITTIDNSSSIWLQDTDQSQESSKDPLSLVQDLLEKYMPNSQVMPPQDIILPFMVGALGLFGYDLGKRFEH
mgnify:FL=1